LKNYYQCLQIAHIINQLVEASQVIKSLANETKESSIKYLWERLKSFLFEIKVKKDELLKLVSKPFQIRLT